MLAVFSLLYGERTHSFYRSFTTATLVHSLNERGYGIYAGQQWNTPGTDVAGSLLPNGMPPGVETNDRTDHEQVRNNDVQKKLDNNIVAHQLVLLKGKELPAHISGSEGLKDLCVIDAIYQAAASGKKVML